MPETGAWMSSGIVLTVLEGGRSERMAQASGESNMVEGPGDKKAVNSALPLL